MKCFFRLAIALAALTAAAGCQEQVPLICPAMPEVRFTPSPSKVYSEKDNLLVNIEAYATEGRETFLCPSTVCFTLDGSTPQEGRASTQCLPAPIKKIPVSKPVCIKYFVKGVDGSQGTVKQACYQLEEAPRSTCTPDSKASGEPVSVTLESTKDGTIFYTTDGTDPDPSGESPDTQSGKAPVSLKVEEQGTTTVRFRAQDVHGNVEHGINSCDYTYDSVPPTTLATPAGSSSNDPIQVTLATNETARIYYTLDGATPNKTRLYSSQDPAAGSTRVAFQTVQVSIDNSTYLRFYAEDIPVGNAESPVQEEIYFIGGKPAVKVEPGTGRFAETEITVTLTGEKSSGGLPAIHYTLDGTNPSCGEPGTLYSVPITDMAKEGDYVLRYIACDGSKNSGVREATYTLGATGNPFFPELNFVNMSNIDMAGSSKTIEVSTREGFRYAQLRRKMPSEIGGGVDNVSIGGIGFPPVYDIPLDLAVTTSVNGAYVHYVSGRQISVYGVFDTSITPFSDLTFTFPEQPLSFSFDPCKTTHANGFALGLELFQDGVSINGIAPWTAATNCGGFARFDYGDYTGTAKPSHPYIVNNTPQFANTEDDPAIADVEGTGELPRSDLAVLNGFAYVPVHTSGGIYQVKKFYGSSGTATTASSPNMGARPMAMDIGVGNTRLAVGDQAGTVYVLDVDTMNQIDSAAVQCNPGKRCRINGITWFRKDSSDFILAAIGAYGDSDTGKLAILKLTGNTLSVVATSALSGSDPFLISSPVEYVEVLPDTNPNADYALLTLRQQGFVVVELSDVPAGAVTSRGYLTQSDIGDIFWASRSASFFSTSLVPRAAVLDTGRDGQNLDVGFRVFDFKDIEKYEMTGTLLTNNLNPGGKSISRVKLIGARYHKGGLWYDSVLPAGLTLTLIGDDVENTQPLNVGSELAFPAQPIDVRAKLSFASPDTGDTTVRIDYLQFKFTPVE